jgi:hypothetical protein
VRETRQPLLRRRRKAIRAADLQSEFFIYGFVAFHGSEVGGASGGKPIPVQSANEARAGFSPLRTARQVPELPPCPSPGAT